MLKIRQHQLIALILLIVILFSALFNVPAALAEGETPTEPPVATEPQTESTPEPTAAPQEPSATPEPAQSPAPEAASSQEPVAPESTPIAAIFADAPEDTSLVVLDDQGQPVSLGTQETAAAVVNSDPVWCPEGQLPGGAGCSTQYATITDLLTAMRTNPAAFAANGTIFLEATTFNTPLILDNSAGSLSSSFATLSSFNLAVRGGYNPATNAVSGTQAVFSNGGYILIGSSTNPWVGNIRLEDITVQGVSAANSITVYTSSGNIVFDDVEVNEQTGGHNTAYLHSQSGNIIVENGSNFDGNDTGTTVNESLGFYAQTGGSIFVDGSDNSQYTFQDSERIGGGDVHHGATLIAPTVTLIDVTSRDNDGNGILIQNANVITLNNVISANTNGTGNGLSGVLVIGTASTVVNVYGGTFAQNGQFGIELFNGTGMLVIHTEPNCTANTLGCYNVVPVGATPTQPTPTQPTPTQPTPTQPTPTQSMPTQSTPTEPTPIQPTPTEVTPTPSTVVPTESTAVPPTSTTPGSGTGGSSGSSSLGTPSSSGAAVIPLTGGELIALSCDSVFWAFGVKLSFIELCDHQAKAEQVAAANLPGDLPEGLSFVMGLDLTILSGGQELETLPTGAGVQFDFPVAAGEYAVLFWDEAAGEWVEVSSSLDAGQMAEALGNEEGDGLYRLSPSTANFLQILTTDKTGIFVLVQK